jgi:hypothetical protein
MKTLVPPVIPFEHRRSLSWPSCPRCGQLCLFVDEANTRTLPFAMNGVVIAAMRALKQCMADRWRPMR